MDSSVLTIIVAVVLLAIVVAVVVGVFIPKQRSKKLREQFGPEYDHMVNEAEGRYEAEAELEARRERVKAFEIHPLSLNECDRFAAEWQSTQAHFVDEPIEAVVQADQLVDEVMKARGYPVADFEQRAADVSVDHAEVVTNYRAAHDIALKNERGEADTEDLRQAMVHYRALFEDLLDVQEDITKHKEKV